MIYEPTAIVKKELEGVNEELARLEVTHYKDYGIKEALKSGLLHAKGALERILANYEKTESKLLETHVATMIQLGIGGDARDERLGKKCREVARKVIEFLKEEK